MPVLRYWDATAGAWVDLGGNSTPEVYVGIDPPTPRAGQVLWVDTDDTAPGLIGQRWSPEYTLTTVSLASGTESGGTPVVTHNLGVVPSLIVGQMEDGSWAAQCAWRKHTLTATQVGVNIMNHGPNAAQVVFRFRLLY
jgi:hypothetical protein